MTSRSHWKHLVCALLVSGCQSASEYLPWQASTTQRYSAEQLASMDDPKPAAARPELAQDLQQSQNGNIRTVSASSTQNQPMAAGRVEQLIKSGQAAIRAAGTGDSAKLDEARQIFQQVLQFDPENASANHGLAIVADLRKEWQAAEYHYKIALQKRPQDPSLLNDLGYSYLLQNRFHEASQYLTQAIQISPQHERAHINLALLSLKRGDRVTAQTQLASIYSPSEVNATLMKLEQDVQKCMPADSMTGLQNSAQATQPSFPTMAVSQPQPFGAQQTFTNQVPWNRGQSATQMPMQAQPGVQQPIQNQLMTNSLQQPGAAPQYAMSPAGSLVQQQPMMQYQPPNQQRPAPQNMIPGVFTPGAPAAPGTQSVSPQSVAQPQKPVHIYPPGIAPEENNAAPATGISEANYPGNMTAPSAAGNAPMAYPHQPTGTPVGGVIAAPTPQAPVDYATQNQFYGSQSAPISSVSHGTAQPLLATSGVDQRIPMAGLNAGPGTLFPVNPAPAASQFPSIPNQNAALNQSTFPGQATIPQPHGMPQQGYPSQTYHLPQQGAVPTGNPSQPGYPQSNMNIQPRSAYQNTPVNTISFPNITPAGYPGQAGGAVNGMQAYEQQLWQQQNSQFNQALQQMDGTHQTAFGAPGAVR